MSIGSLRIFISSPGDVAEERVIARRVVARLASQIGDALRLIPVFWEHQPLVATATFQEQLLLPAEADIVLVILWSRLGTPLPGHIRRADGSLYDSGTEFEVENALEEFRRNGKPQILAYRKTAQAPVPQDDTLLEDYVRQKQALDRFVVGWFHNESDGSLRAAFHPFASPADFEELLEAHLTRLIDPHLPPGVRTAAPTWRTGSPFRGLEAFEPEHAPVFFGRTGAVADVLMKLRLQGERGRAFVLVVGMSGGGKSSLVRAGVLPLLLQPGVVGQATSWRSAIVRPSEGQGVPAEALVRGLMQPGALPDLADQALDVARPVALAAQVIAALAAAGDAAAARGSAPGECHLVVVVDQLEELFSDERTDAAGRKAFVDVLSALARCGKVWVIATLRSDVYPRLVELPELIALKEGDGQLDLMPPSTRDIGQIVRLPAAAAGLRFETRPHTAERLDEVVRDAAARNPGALPLLQFLLEELYKKRNGEGMLTFNAYEELGGVEGALARRADAVLEGVGEEARASLPTVLRELVTFGADDESRPLRRIAPRSAFTTAGSNELVDALIEARLLVSTLDEQGVAAISLAHEALLDFWPRLRAWREQDRELLLVHARVTAAARTWEKQQRSSDFLLARGKPLAEARALAENGIRLSASESALLVESGRRAGQFARLRAGAIAGLAVLTVVAGVAAYRATSESARARMQAITAQKTTDFMMSLFSTANPEENRGRAVTVREILDKGVVQIQEGLSGEDGVRGNLLRSMGQAYDGLGLSGQARPLLAQAASQAERGGSLEDRLRAHLALANNRFNESDPEEAARLYRIALAEARQLYGERHPQISEALVGLANALADLKQSAEAERLYRAAIADNLKMHGERHADTSLSIKKLADLLQQENRFDESEGLYRRALEIDRHLFGQSDFRVARVLSELGSLYYQTGRFDAASKSWLEALPMYRHVFGDEYPDVAATLNNVGRNELMAGRLDAAEMHLTEALRIERKILAAGHSELVFPLNSLAMVKIERGDFDLAERLLAEALSICRADRHALLYQVLASYTDLYIRTSRLPLARAALDEAKSVLQSQYGSKLASTEAWRLAVLDSVMASYDLRAGRADLAEPLLLTALPTLEARFGERGLYVSQANSRLADVYRAQGQPGKAQAHAARLADSAVDPAFRGVGKTSKAR